MTSNHKSSNILNVICKILKSMVITVKKKNIKQRKILGLGIEIRSNFFYSFNILVFLKFLLRKMFNFKI